MARILTIMLLCCLCLAARAADIVIGTLFIDTGASTNAITGVVVTNTDLYAGVASTATSSLGVVTVRIGSNIVDEAARGRLDALEYSAPSITSLTGGGTHYKGQVVASPVITWTVNKTMTARAISGVLAVDLGAGGSGNYTDVGRNMDKDSPVKTYTLTVGDGVGTDAEGETWTFTNYKYVGASAVSPPDNDLVVAMTASAQTKGASGTAAGLATEYIVVAYPASLGAATVFKLGGLTSSDWDLTTFNITNAHGFAESFRVYVSPDPLVGSMSYECD